MGSCMEKIKTALLTVFPEINIGTVTEKLKLVTIPGWDSMNSINLQIELEKHFNIELSDSPLGDEQTVSDVIDIIRHKGGII
jgi:acyl carrier protein